MPPTIKVSKDRIVDTAYQLTKDKGFDCVTARKLAKEIGCSTQPIFRVYPGMEELKKEVRTRASEEFSSRLSASLVADPQMYATLLNVGIMYVDFAIQQPNLFRMLFMEEGSRFEDMLYGRELKSILLKKEGRPGAPVLSMMERQYLFMQMWIFAHGMATMVLTKDLSLDAKDIRDLLSNWLSQML